MMLAILLAVAFSGLPNPAWAQQAREKEFDVPFISLPLRGFFYPPAKVGTNSVHVVVRNHSSTMEYRFESLAPNTLHTLWFLNLFMVTRQGPFVGSSPPSPQGNPFLPWATGISGAGFDANGDGAVMCGEGIDGFDPATGQAPVFDQNSFCSDIDGHANPIIRLPFDVTDFIVPAQLPPLLQTEVVTMLNGKTEKRRHIIDIAYMRVFEEEDPARLGFQKLDTFGRPELRRFRTAPYIVCAHLDGLVGFTHGHHPGDGPDGGPTSTVLGSDHECLMAGMPTSQARTADEQ